MTMATTLRSWRLGAVLAALAALLLAGCGAPPAFQVNDTVSPRIGTIESIRSETHQNTPNAMGAIGGALIGGGLGSLVGGGTGRTVATVVGAVGGAYVGNELANRDTTLVWIITIRYDDGAYGTVQQTSAPGLRIGDRVRVSSSGIELLRR